MAKRIFLEKAKKQVQESYGQDAHAIQAVRSLDDLDEINALLLQRLEEWFKISFPEVPLSGEDLAYYVANADDEGALQKHWPKDKLDEIKQKAESTFGVALGDEDKRALRLFSSLLWQSYKTRKELEDYVRAVTSKTMPNMCALVDGVLAARLLAVAGSLEKLARFPASTLQVLGAEKALFKHLRRGTLPPKHGLIFQSPYVNAQPFDKRGKAARALAAKLAIALKADFYTRHDIGQKLKADLEKRLEQIKALPTRDIKPREFHDFAQRRFERRGPSGDFRTNRRSGPFKGFGAKKPFRHFRKKRLAG